MNLVVSTALAVWIAIAESGATVISDRLQHGRQAYEAVCAGCHDSGSSGAPVIGRPGDWVGRSQLWEAVLFEHADKGYLGMPARGGSEDASEYDVDAAAEYMLTVTHPELPED